MNKLPRPSSAWLVSRRARRVCFSSSHYRAIVACLQRNRQIVGYLKDMGGVVALPNNDRFVKHQVTIMEKRVKNAAVRSWCAIVVAGDMLGNTPATVRAGGVHEIV